MDDIEPADQRSWPRHLKSALAYMRANISERITLTGLSSACGVPERTLLRQFQRFVGLAPLAYLRRLRLNVAKSELVSAQCTDAISDIAMRCGFSHLGRFATEYRRLFGETPSITRERVRARAVDSTLAKNSGSSRSSPLPMVERAMPSLLILPLRTETLQERIEARDLTERLAATLSPIRFATVALAPASSRPVSVSAPQPRHASTQYCLLGRLMRRDERSRVIVRLIDAATDRHLWGDSFDGFANDPFELQDRVVDGVLFGVVSRITDTEIERANNKDPRDCGARDLVLQALPLVLSTSVRSAERAIVILNSAIAMDPADAVATALLGYCHAQISSYHGTASVEASRATARHLFQRAGQLDNDDPLVTIARGTVASFLRQPEEEALVARALAMDPTSAWAWERRAYIRQGEAFRLRSSEAADTAIRDFHWAMRLRGPGMPRANCLHGIASAHYAAGRYQEAADWARKALAENPQMDWVHKLLSCSANRLGDKATVARSVDCMRRARPHLTVAEIVGLWPWAHPGWLETITRAGMPLGSTESRRVEWDAAEHADEIRVKG
jgi:AraC-like DNA-binding protein/tetratricopeptide (TPR) repeat protein